MNWPVVRLIAGREFRDLMRDRRSVILLLVLPIFLYPGFAAVAILFALSLLEQVSTIGVVGLDALPQPSAQVRAAGAWWTVMPGDAANGLAASESIRLAADLRVDSPLVSDGKFAVRFCNPRRETDLMKIVPLTQLDRSVLSRRRVDAILVIPPDCREKLAADQTVTFELIAREGDELSKLAERRLQGILNRYESALRLSRFSRRGLAADFDNPLIVHNPKDDDEAQSRSTEEIRDRLAHFFPFLLVMWVLAGALHPAIDVCAGEKERGTMETLLLCPVERSEVVAGKFLAVMLFSLATALWNLVWMSGLCAVGSWWFESPFMHWLTPVWCIVLTIPLAALFSALALALGVYARSTKEGQYYLLPLFLGVIPLVMLSLMPNAELTVGTSVIPVTGSCLLLTRLLGPSPELGLLLYLIPIGISMALCVLVAGLWAVWQFHREDVLFREADAGQLSGRKPVTKIKIK